MDLRIWYIIFGILLSFGIKALIFYLRRRYEEVSFDVNDIRGTVARALGVLERARLEHTFDKKRVQASIALREVCDNPLLRKDNLVPHAERMLKLFRNLHHFLLSDRMETDLAWRYGEVYSYAQYDAITLLILFRHLRYLEIYAALEDAEEMHDPLLQYYALESLHRLGKTVSPKAIADTATSAQTRNMLYNHLREIGKPELYPREYLNQEAFAESELVAWLSHPTELGRPPAEIAMEEVVSKPEDPPGDGALDFYIFRFLPRMSDGTPHKEWLLGVAGPYFQADCPTTESFNFTFSFFNLVGSITHEDLIAKIIKLGVDRVGRKEVADID